jgi:hypothetical protein
MVRSLRLAGVKDMRKGFVGLSSLEEQALGGDPHGRLLFVFRSAAAIWSS